MASTLFTRILLSTALLGLASSLSFLGYRAVTGAIERKLFKNTGTGDALGWLVMGGILAAFTAFLIMVMAMSPDPLMKRIICAVLALVALGLTAAVIWRWSGHHRHPAVRTYLSIILRETASRAALASLLAVLILLAAWMRREPAGLAGFLASTLAYLACWIAVFTAKFGWWPFSTKLGLYILISPLRPRRDFITAFRAALGEYLSLTPLARSTLRGSYLGILVTSLLMTFALFAPLAALNRAAMHPGTAKLAWAFVLGMIGGSIFMVLLPIMMLAGFVFAFILLPIGALRGSAGVMSGGAGAGGKF